MTLLENWKKLWNMKVIFISIVIGALDTVTERLLKGPEDLEMRTSGDRSNYCIIKIGQNTEMSPGDMRRIADTQTQVKEQGTNGNNSSDKKWIWIKELSVICSP